MNKKFFVAWVLIFIVWMAASFIVHGMLLSADYLSTPALFRTEAEQQQYFPWMLVAHVVGSGAFVWIYARGVEAKPWLAQGLRYAVPAALLSIVPMYLIYYAVQPMAASTVVKQVVFDGVTFLVLGALVAFLYRGHVAD